MTKAKVTPGASMRACQIAIEAQDAKQFAEIANRLANLFISQGDREGECIRVYETEAEQFTFLISEVRQRLH